MSNINSLITEYCTLTGRPVATLSVDEFLSFKKVESNIIVIPNDAKSIEYNFSDYKEKAPVREKQEIKAQKREVTTSKDNNLANMLKSIPG